MSKLESMIENQHFEQLQPQLDEFGREWWPASNTLRSIGVSYDPSDPKSWGVSKTNEAKLFFDQVLSEETHFILLPSGDYLLDNVANENLISRFDPSYNLENWHKYALTSGFTGIMAHPKQQEIDKLHPQDHHRRYTRAMRDFQKARSLLDSAAANQGLDTGIILSKADETAVEIDTRQIAAAWQTKGVPVDQRAPIFFTKIRTGYITSGLYRVSLTRQQRIASGEDPEAAPEGELESQIVAAAASLGILVAERNIKIDDVQRWRMHKNILVPDN